jgi:hypothetical protein
MVNTPRMPPPERRTISTTSRSQNASEACHQSSMGGTSEKEGALLAVQVHPMPIVRNLDTITFQKPPTGFLLTKDDVTKHDAVLNATKRPVYGQKRWIQHVRGPRRNLKHKLEELQCVVRCFQQPQSEPTTKNGPSQSTLVTPRLLVCTDKTRELYRHATLEEIMRNISNKRGHSVPQKGNIEKSNTGLVVVAAPTPSTQTLVQRTTSDNDVHQPHTPTLSTTKGTRQREVAPSTTMPVCCCCCCWTSTAGVHCNSVEPRKTLRQFIEDFKHRLLHHELPVAAARRYECDSPKNFLSYLDSCLTMPFVNDNLIRGRDEADRGEIRTSGNHLTRLVILSLWSQLVVDSNSTTRTSGVA